MKQKAHVTWEEIEKHVNTLAKQIKPLRDELTGIFGVPRGGLVPAAMLAYRLDLPMVTHAAAITNKVLVVDDIVDSGKTLKVLVDKFGAVKTASLYYNSKSSIAPMFHAQHYQDNLWLVFPWETVKSSKYDKTVWQL